MTNDMDVLDELKEGKKEKPELAKLLSKDKLDDFELDVMMSDWE